MRPHMAHIHKTMVRKQLAERAKDAKGPMNQYRRKVEAALAQGYFESEIIHELEGELSRIETDEQEGDQLHQEGVKNVKSACKEAIETVIAELRSKD